jgi:mannose-6-phosphate isomerase class I
MEQKILFLQPVFTHNIWGGTKLRDEYGYDIDGNDIGECWGISAHSHGDCIVREGKYKGLHFLQPLIFLSPTTTSLSWYRQTFVVRAYRRGSDESSSTES